MPQRSSNKTIYYVARKRDDLERAFSLVYKEYASRGYIPKDYKSKIRLSLYSALPSTTTFIAKQRDKVVATVTLIPDSPMGVPMDKIYKKELDVFRKKKLRIAEVSQLSIDEKLFPKGWFSMFNFSKLIFVFALFKLVFDYARNIAELDELCIAVNPKHQYLYKFIFFEPIGGLKYYGSVNKAPALAFHLSLNEELKKKSFIKKKAVHKIFYGKNVNSQGFKNKFVMKPEDLEYFFLEKSDLLKKATKEELAYIKKCYPPGSVGAILKKHG